MRAHLRSALATGAMVLLAAAGATGAAAQTVRVGEVPLVTGGGFYIAMEKGYFAKLGLTVQPKRFNDGALVVPAMLAGELEIGAVTAAAGLFNSVAKGAPLVVIYDRGNNRPGRGFTAVNVTPELYEDGLRSAANFAKLKGKKIGIGALGSINQYDAGLAMVKAGLDPRKDVTWVTNVPQPDLMKMLGTKQVDATDLAYQFGHIAAKTKMGPMVAKGDDIDPDGQIGMFAARREFLASRRDVAIRWAMACLQGAKEFNAAAANPGANKEIVEILAKTTAFGKPEPVIEIAPNWSYVNEDGIPNVKSVMAMQSYWADYFTYVEKKVPEAQLFDLSIAKEAVARLAKDNPFVK